MHLITHLIMTMLRTTNNNDRETNVKRSNTHARTHAHYAQARAFDDGEILHESQMYSDTVG